MGISKAAMLSTFVLIYLVMVRAMLRNTQLYSYTDSVLALKKGKSHMFAFASALTNQLWYIEVVCAKILTLFWRVTKEQLY